MAAAVQIASKWTLFVLTVSICRTEAVCAARRMTTGAALMSLSTRHQLKTAVAPQEAMEHLGWAASGALLWKVSTAANQIKRFPSFDPDSTEITLCFPAAAGNLKRALRFKRVLSERGPVLEGGIRCARTPKMNATLDAHARNAARCFT